MSSKPSADTLVHIDPSSILMEDNARFSTIVPEAEAAVMCASILNVGRIMEPVGVTPLSPPVNGYSYRLRYGFRRVAGALLANQSGAGVQVPALILHDADEQGTLREQVTENVVRNSLSLMDTATAAKKMLDSGMARADVRAAFTRPSGTKGAGAQEASNAWLNMVLGLLELPKAIQNRIHSGDIGIAAAYRLMKAPPDKRLAILEAAEKVQADIRANEEKEEAKFSELEERIKVASEGEQAAAVEADQLKAAVEVSAKAVEEAKEEARRLYKVQREAETAVKKVKNKEAKEKAKAALKAALESYKASETDVKAAEKRLAEDEKALDKAATSQKKFTETAESLREKLRAKQEAASTPKKKAKGSPTAISPKAVEQAAKAAGVETGKVKLNAAQMRKTVEDLSVVSTHPKVAAIGKELLACFNSDITPGTLIKHLALLTGEGKPTAAKK